MFATCMPFQVTYVLCVILWVTFPDVKGREILPTVFPGFKMVTVGNFIYGFFASMVYEWAVVIVFVFFNLWPQLVAALFGPRAVRHT